MRVNQDRIRNEPSSAKRFSLSVNSPMFTIRAGVDYEAPHRERQEHADGPDVQLRAAGAQERALVAPEPDPGQHQRRDPKRSICEPTGRWTFTSVESTGTKNSIARNAASSHGSGRRVRGKASRILAEPEPEPEPEPEVAVGPGAALETPI